MTVRVYRSDDASAPLLTGTIGSLITVLDACLVNGYGSKAAAGWSKAFSSTNLAAYRPPSGTRGYLRVDDTAAQIARIVGYMTMTDVNTGADQFPTSTQISGGAYSQKSLTADTTARPWVLIATDSRLYWLNYSDSTTITGNNSTAGCSGHFFFGDAISYKPGDAYHCTLICSDTSGTSASRLGFVSTSGNMLAGHYIARPHAQSGTSQAIGKAPLGIYGSPSTIGTSGSLPAYPDVMTGGLPITPIELFELVSSTPVVRGKLPGMWAPMVGAPAAQADTFDGAGELAGKTFILLNVASASTLGRAAFEISDTW